MKVHINGKEEELNGNKITVIELLKIKEVETPEMVSVQLNGNILSRRDYDSTSISENDNVRFLYFMGGG